VYEYVSTHGETADVPGNTGLAAQLDVFVPGLKRRVGMVASPAANEPVNVAQTASLLGGVVFLEVEVTIPRSLLVDLEARIDWNMSSFC
jgi:hypothetical protein